MNAQYATIAAAIRYLQAHRLRQPGLEELATQLGLSGAHLQRVFADWAGVSPKRFLQYLTKQHARELLRANADVFATALESGLSGAGRLHDLMVSCEALSPGEVRAQGGGVTIRHACADSVFGRFLVGSTDRGICHLAFHVDDMSDAMAVAALRAEWPAAVLLPDGRVAAEIAPQLQLLAVGKVPLRLLLRGTNFQLKVWEALLRIPAGSVVSYAELARGIGQPRAARAVGSAVAANRIALLIPCHRVIRESGEIGEYRWQSERKLALIAREQAGA
ncbi:MAG: 6-O-methylguanine DNA methyltransferase [Candidatus Dactylopiibacterium carminicum]|uniref:methylated-DNA--[protein]-cysteine S-methyltransferase n=1 Tax=Candidatus Dactylopiibacterium carminicum TaxID=857335 RepID=A0A272EVM3_9RHOO|nr:methylated-DNA--[protein]-cysteine S-methyltransferase [Candidatus Dactylopiibacterium carminicum]KAF7599898.1 6-O-methylguanine DNA methyltransferase [Candidatus Dactylopiibacterium carminicum]PAS94163.1 MAG: 6-O-methylguanine DNA methyltransferase [Candidatus Dactylopiibacterium carminicum]PAS99899.1 MAG: 6-O-methylguanine DNA methyltransferase [Candidatus Dactylopiibacterium carminicum]